MEETGVIQEVSTPAETSAEDTSANVEPASADTSTAEPEVLTEAAETEGNTSGKEGAEAPETLYAGKYKTVEDLVNGYNESQKFVTKAAELEKRIDEMLKKQSNAEAEAQQKRVQEAQQRGFNTAEEAEISDRVTLAEFELYANGVNYYINPEHQQAVSELLRNYYVTANPEFLKAAKNYFPSDFVEYATGQKSELRNRLTTELTNKTRAEKDAREAKLGEMLREEYKDFLADKDVNEGKRETLKQFCNAGFITSSEDMKVFQDLYTKIADYERAQAIKEYEAAKTIEKTKEGAQIDANINNQPGSAMPTQAQLAEMSQEDYERAVAKYGLEKLL